jgi:hypothetical protein
VCATHVFCVRLQLRAHLQACTVSSAGRTLPGQMLLDSHNLQPALVFYCIAGSTAMLLLPAPVKQCTAHRMLPMSTSSD